MTCVIAWDGLCYKAKSHQPCVDQSEDCTGIMVDYFWTNKSVPRLFLFKQITVNTVRRRALALEVPALKANNGVSHTQLFPVGGHICSTFSCSYDFGSL